jgi:hypothetical protein
MTLYNYQSSLVTDFLQLFIICGQNQNTCHHSFWKFTESNVNISFHLFLNVMAIVAGNKVGLFRWEGNYFLPEFFKKVFEVMVHETCGKNAN